MIKIENAKQEYLKHCAKILMDIYNSNVLDEGWTVNSANEICQFYFNMQSDLFFVAKSDNEIIGFTYCYIKPYPKGKALMIEELSVKEEFRKQGVGKQLLKTLVENAKLKYNVEFVNGATYNGECGMPYSWYERINFKKVEDLFLIQGTTDNILKSLK